ncbi:MAG: TolC family protein [Gammaproteobacteria bacterium]|nr:TolC family protein [Gammaproteobacteria bacterium]
MTARYCARSDALARLTPAPPSGSESTVTRLLATLIVLVLASLPARSVAESGSGTLCAVAAAAWANPAMRELEAPGWLQRIDNRQLADIVAEALRHNRDLATTAANLETAADLVARAAMALVPAVGVDKIPPGLTELAPVAPLAAASPDLPWEPSPWRLMVASDAAAAANCPDGDGELDHARHLLAARIAETWLLTAEANLQLELADDAVGLRERILQLVEIHLAAGTTTEDDLVEARRALSRSRARQFSAIGALTNAIRAMHVLLGRYPTAELRQVEHRVPVLPALPDNKATFLLTLLPTQVEAERQLRGLAAEIAGVLRAHAEALQRVQQQAEGNAGDPLRKVRLQARILDARIAVTRVRNALLSQRLLLHLALEGWPQQRHEP